MGFGVLGVGCGVWGLGFGVWCVGCGVWCLVFGVWGLGFGVWGLGFTPIGHEVAEALGTPLEIPCERKIIKRSMTRVHQTPSLSVTVQPSLDRPLLSQNLPPMMFASTAWLAKDRGILTEWESPQPPLSLSGSHEVTVVLVTPFGIP